MSLSPAPNPPILIDSRPKRPLDSSTERSSSEAKQRELTAIGAVLDGLARPAVVIEEVLRIIAEKSAVIMDATGAAIVLQEKGEFVCRATHGQAMPLGSRMDTSSGLSGECIRMGSAVRCDDAEVDPRVNAEACRSLNVRSVAAVPVVCGGEILGLVEMFSSRAHAFSDEDLASLRRMASAVVAAVNQSTKLVEPRFHTAEPEPCSSLNEDQSERNRGSWGAPHFVYSYCLSLLSGYFQVRDLDSMRIQACMLIRRYRAHRGRRTSYQLSCAMPPMQVTLTQNS
jgi:putative methionine-R-sulfoxide reductase with GAF domain